MYTLLSQDPYRNPRPAFFSFLILITFLYLFILHAGSIAKQAMINVIRIRIEGTRVRGQVMDSTECCVYE